jgi:hypothetical protein
VIGSQDSLYVGVLAGEDAYGQVLNCATSGHVSAPGGTAGGLAGHTYNTRITRSRGNVSVQGVTAGGLIGFSDRYTAIAQSFATGSVSGTTYAGGLIGGNYFTVLVDSYATGSVNSGTNAGGLTGEEGSSLTTRFYAIGTVQSPQNAGGAFGYTISESPSGDYWDIDTSGTDQGCGEVYFADCSGVIGLSDAQLKSGLPAGFDPAIWAQSPGINNGYPYLIANPPPQ